MTASAWCHGNNDFLQVDQKTMFNYTGPDFLVLFFSDSRSLALKSSLKINQMTTFWIQNEDWDNKRHFIANGIIFHSIFILYEKKFLFDDFLMTTWELRARERESEKKRTRKSWPMKYVNVFSYISFTCTLPRLQLKMIKALFKLSLESTGCIFASLLLSG